MMRLLLFDLALLGMIPASYSQKIERYYDFQWHDTSAANARFYGVLEHTDSGWTRKDYFLHSLFLQMDGLYQDSACKVPAGRFHYYYANRGLEMMGAYSHGKKQGLWLTYYSNGMMADSTVYSDGQPIGVRESWYRNGYAKDSAVYASDGSGLSVSWFDNGNPAAAGRFAPGYKPFGKWQYFYRSGKLSSIELYDRDGKLQEKEYYDEQGGLLPDTTTRNRKAEFPGGQMAWSRYLSKALYFPEQYQITNGDQAAVVVNATVDEQGNIVDAEVAVPFYPAFDKIALEAIRKSPHWIPAFEHNRPVRSEIRQPVIFSQPD